MAAYTSPSVGGISISFPNVQEGQVEDIRYKGAVPPTGPGTDSNPLDRSAPAPYEHDKYPESPWWPVNPENTDPGIRGKHMFPDWPGEMLPHHERKDDPTIRRIETPENIKYIPDLDGSFSINTLPDAYDVPGYMSEDPQTKGELELRERRHRTRDYKDLELFRERDQRLINRDARPNETDRQEPTTDTGEDLPEGFENEDQVNSQIEKLSTMPKDKAWEDEAVNVASGVTKFLMTQLALPLKIAEVIADTVVEGVRGTHALATIPINTPEDIEAAAISANKFATAYTMGAYARNFRVGDLGAELSVGGGKMGPGRLGLITEKSNHILQREPKIIEEAMTKLKTEAEVLELNKNIPQIKARVDSINEDMAAIESLTPSRDMLQRAIRDLSDMKKMKTSATGDFAKMLDDNMANVQKIADLLEKQIEKGTDALIKRSPEMAEAIDGIPAAGRGRQIESDPYVDAQIDQQLKKMFGKGPEDITPLERIEILAEQRDRFLNILKDPKLDPLERVSIQDMIGSIENEILGRAGAATDLKLIKGGKPGKPANDNDPGSTLGVGGGRLKGPRPSEIDQEAVRVFQQQYPHMTKAEIIEALYPEFSLANRVKEVVKKNAPKTDTAVQFLKGVDPKALEPRAWRQGARQLNEREITLAKEMQEQGLTFTEIAKEVGVSIPTITKILRKGYSEAVANTGRVEKPPVLSDPAIQAYLVEKIQEGLMTRKQIADSINEVFKVDGRRRVDAKQIKSHLEVLRKRVKAYGQDIEKGLTDGP